MAEETRQHPCEVQLLWGKAVRSGLLHWLRGLSSWERPWLRPRCRDAVGVMERLSSETSRTWVSPGLSTSIAAGLWKRHLTALNLDFPTCKMGISGNMQEKGSRGLACETTRCLAGEAALPVVSPGALPARRKAVTSEKLQSNLFGSHACETIFLLPVPMFFSLVALWGDGLECSYLSVGTGGQSGGNVAWRVLVRPPAAIRQPS